MLKECRVELNNEACTVIDVDGKKVQIPPILRKESTVKVVIEKGRYQVVGDDYVERVEEPEQPEQKVQNKKKTTREKVEE